MQNPDEFYDQKIKKYIPEIDSVSGSIKRYAWYRFFAFLSVFIPLYFPGTDSPVTPFLSAALIALFLFLIKKNHKLEKRHKKLNVLKKIAEDETEAIHHSFSRFPSGVEYSDGNHAFSYDLDLFGEGSLFQYINRTVTTGGRNRLAGWLTSPFTQKNEILSRQEAVRELSLIPNWRLHFLANGKLFEETPEMFQEMKNWAELDLKSGHPALIRRFILIVPLLTMGSVIPGILSGSWTWLLLMILIQWILTGVFGKTIRKYYRFFGQKSDLLSKYQILLEFIGTRDFDSALLKRLRKTLNTPESAGTLFNQLNQTVQRFEYRQNILVGLFLNSLFLWDIRCMYKLWKWHDLHHTRVGKWMDVIAETDALVSLGNYACNNPGYHFPEIHEGGFMLQAEQLGHPLLHPDKRKNNDIEINGWSKVIIITGANMAGKSTFLRTVGISLVLAGTGAPVCASRLVISPVNIFTNMRTTDSLQKEESYFFAELKRIKKVLERLDNGERIFVILDEMLKGTNSVDKLHGSRELIRRLLELKAVALVATHDLKLSELEANYPQQVINKCFEIRIKDQEMIFDYTLTDGVTRTMNATFLMKKMGII